MQPRYIVHCLAVGINISDMIVWWLFLDVCSSALCIFCSVVQFI
jgi:hypothetical protein